MAYTTIVEMMCKKRQERSDAFMKMFTRVDRKNGIPEIALRIHSLISEYEEISGAGYHGRYAEEYLPDIKAHLVRLQRRIRAILARGERGVDRQDEQSKPQRT